MSSSLIPICEECHRKAEHWVSGFPGIHVLCYGCFNDFLKNIAKSNVNAPTGSRMTTVKCLNCGIASSNYIDLPEQQHIMCYECYRNWCKNQGSSQTVKERKGTQLSSSSHGGSELKGDDCVKLSDLNKVCLFMQTHYQLIMELMDQPADKLKAIQAIIDLK